MKKIIFGINLILPPGATGLAQNQKNSGLRLESRTNIQGNSLNAPMSAAIIGITQATADTNIGDSSDSDISGRPGSSRSVSSGSGSDGLLGGVGNTVGGVIKATTQTVGRVTGTAGQIPGGAARPLGRITGEIRIFALNLSSGRLFDDAFYRER